MKSLLFFSTCGLMLAAASACAPLPSATARVALDCPTNEGGLRLSNVSSDKKTCLYASSDGDQVSLRLMPVLGSYEATLQPIEQELQGEVETQQPAKAVAEGKKGSGSTSENTEASKAAQQAAQDAGGASKLEDDGSGHDGDRAHIDLPGIHISADDDKANVNVGGIDVNAGENGATVRMSRDVRMRGEGFSPRRNGFRSTFILARDDLRDGWKAVGYEAGGPKTGPITVAVFKAHEGHHRGASEAVKRLVRRNAGV